MKAKGITSFLYFLCACSLVICLTGCDSSSDGGVLTPPDDAVQIEDLSDDPGGGDGGGDDGGDDGDGSGDDEATDDETTP